VVRSVIALEDFRQTRESAFDTVAQAALRGRSGSTVGADDVFPALRSAW
jgi:hypothetical protein